MAQLLRANGTIEHLGGPLSLEQLQDAVGGDIEMVRLGVTPTGAWVVLFVDEDGQRNGKAENVVASALAARDYWLLGDAVLCRVTNPGQEDERVD